MSAGVMHGGALVVADKDGGWRLLPAGYGWAGLYGAAVELGVSTVFALGGVGVDAGGELAGVDVEVTGSQPDVWRWRLSTPAGRVVDDGDDLGPVGGRVVEVVDVDADRHRLAGPWDALEARELVDVLGAVERLLGVPWASSVGRTAERLILSTHPRGRGGTLLDRAPVIPEPAAGSSLETAWQSWRRELTAGERSARWLHAFDANAQYLGAWSTSFLGHGVPVHHGRPGFDPKVAGLWRVPGLDALRIPFGELLPVPWIRGREWFTTPTIARVLEVAHGLDVPEVVESWRWPAQSRFLRGAAERLRDARRTAMTTRTAAAAAIRGAVDEDDALNAVRRLVLASTSLDAVKAIYRVQTGRFGMAARDAASPWARPDWGHEIRATARVNLHRRLSKLGAAPFGIATDGLVFADNEPDPVVFARRIGLTLGDGLGEYRHTGTAPAPAVGELVDVERARVAPVLAAMGKVLTS